MHSYNHHIGDLIRDTARLSDAQCMAYLRLLWRYYDQEAPLPNDPAFLAFHIGSDALTVDLLLRSFFKLGDDGLWHQKRCDEEIASYHAYIESQRTNGAKGGRPSKPTGKRRVSTAPPPPYPKASTGASDSEKKATDNPSESDGIPGANPEQTRRDPDVNPNRLTVNRISTPNGVDSALRASRLPKDWTLPAEWLEEALRIRSDWTAAHIPVVAESFRDYWIAKPGKDGLKLDWLATWRNWVRSQDGGPLKPRQQTYTDSIRSAASSFMGPGAKHGNRVIDITPRDARPALGSPNLSDDAGALRDEIPEPLENGTSGAER